MGPVLFFGTETMKDGFPFASAAFKLYKETRIQGNYRRSDETLSIRVDPNLLVLDGSESFKAAIVNRDEIEENDYDDTEILEYLNSISLLYYSKEEFREINFFY
jgi:hypothetical protein